MSLYTREARQIVTGANWPKDFKYVIDEWDLYLRFVMFRDNWIELTRDEQWQAVGELRRVLEEVNKLGIPMQLKEMEGQVRERIIQ